MLNSGVSAELLGGLSSSSACKSLLQDLLSFMDWVDSLHSDAPVSTVFTAEQELQDQRSQIIPSETNQCQTSPLSLMSLFSLCLGCNVSAV